MTHPRCLDRAAVTAAALAAGAALLSPGPASAEPPDDYAPNPPSPPTLTMSTPEVVEGTGGPNEMVFTFTLDEPAGGGEFFRFYTEDAQGSALPVEDHDPMLEFPVFGAGDTELTVPIPLVTDSVPEADESILVHMDHPTGLAIPDGSGIGFIIDDDHRERSTPDETEDPDPDRDPGRPTRPAADDLAPATTTTTTTRPTALDATLTASNGEATIDLRPAAAIVLVALGLLSLVAAWRTRQR